MARVEYMVTWKRVGLRPKRKRYVSRHAADRFMALLGPEPWAALGLDPDMPYCCHASCVECDCDGRTVREESDRMRAEMPPLEWVRLSTREVGEWVSAPAEEEGREERGKEKRK